MLAKCCLMCISMGGSFDVKVSIIFESSNCALTGMSIASFKKVQGKDTG